MEVLCSIHYGRQHIRVVRHFRTRLVGEPIKIERLYSRFREYNRSILYMFGKQSEAALFFCLVK